MILENYSYSKMFSSKFSPHPETFVFNWTVEEKKTSKKATTEVPKTEPIKSNSKDLQPVGDTSISYEIKDITPKKLFWRK